MSKSIQFVAVPKCAGVSCEKFCEANEIPVRWHHRNYCRYVSELYKGFHSTDKTVFVWRDPVERVVSAYFFLKQGGINQMDRDDWDRYCKPYANINEFVEKGLGKAMREQIHFMPQYLWLNPPMTRLSSWGKMICIDFDNLEMGLDRLAEVHGLKREPLPTLNQSQKEEFVFDHDEALSIANLYAADYEFRQFMFDNEAVYPSF